MSYNILVQTITKTDGCINYSSQVLEFETQRDANAAYYNLSENKPESSIPNSVYIQQRLTKLY